MDTEEGVVSADAVANTTTEPVNAAEADATAKKVCGAAQGAAAVAAPQEIPGACLIKLYDTNLEDIKVCDIVEFFGVVSFDPELATFSDGSSDMVQEEALQAPSAAVPRLHCFVHRKIPTDTTALPEPAPAVLQKLAPEMAGVRSAALGAFGAALGGDMLAAEYVLLHVLSGVSTRLSGCILGKLALNLCCGEHTAHFSGALERTFEALLPRSVVLPLTLQSLSARPFFPTKDYSSNRLRGGALQVCDHTQLLIDQTGLMGGQLPTIGVLNVNAITKVVQQQMLDYDFQFYQQPFNVNLRTLVMSDGKSLFPVDCHVFLRPEAEPSMGAVGMGEAQLEAVRAYLAAVASVEYVVTDEMAKIIEEDFVRLRAANPATVTAETLNTWMQLARLVAVSMGNGILGKEHWDHVQTMENARVLRLPSQPMPPQAL